MSSVIVVGAGLAGLTAAFRLKQAGWDCKLFESGDAVGGRAASFRKQGYLFDTGAVGLATAYRDFVTLMGDLGLTEHIVASSSIVATCRANRLYETDSARPISALTSRLLSVGSKLKLINLFLDLARLKPRLNIRDVSAAAEFDDETIEAYAKRRLNAELLQYFIEPLTRTVNLNRARNISKLEVMNSLAGLFGSKLFHLRGGIEIVTHALSRGLDVQLRATVTSVKRLADRVEVNYRDSGGAVSTEYADCCVLATALPDVLTIFPDANSELAPLADTMSYNRGLCVHLGYKAPVKSKALMAMMPPAEHAEIALIFFEHNKAPDRAPLNHSLLTVFYDHSSITRPWSLSDDQLVRETSKAAEHFIPELAHSLEMSHVSRWTNGLWNPALGTYKAMAQVNRQLDSSGRVQYAGDYRSTPGQNSAVASGNDAAANLHARFGHQVSK